MFLIFFFFIQDTTPTVPRQDEHLNLQHVSDVDNTKEVEANNAEPVSSPPDKFSYQPCKLVINDIGVFLSI
jgi:hypothetical protein